MIIYRAEYPIEARLYDGVHLVWIMRAPELFSASQVRFIEWPKAPREPGLVTWMAPDGATRVIEHWKGPPHGDWVG